MRRKRGNRRIQREIECFALFLIFLAGWLGTAQAAPQVGAQAYALLEASTGRVLLEHNADAELPMASTTKIMTCIVAIEEGDLDAVVEVPDEAVGVEGSSMYLQRGETLTLRDLLYGLMLASGNDAAVTIAVHIAGSVENFAAKMNEKAVEFGAVHTHFVTPNGLPAEGHYTTAHDLAKISAYAMGNETFREIVGTSSKNLPQDDDSPARYLRSKNKMLYQYEGGNGIKTGYTKAAGKCLSAGAARGGMQLVAVVLNDGDMFSDCYALLDYGFSEYSMQRVTQAGEPLGSLQVQGGVEDRVEIAINDEIALPLRAEEYKIIERKVNVVSEIQAPVRRGTVVGTIEFRLGEELCASGEIVATQDVAENTYEYNLSKILEQWIG